tara:strand:+ start:1198 stop:1368 length:171 start_codon:yes stop_codon:yes gene_type:complete
VAELAETATKRDEIPADDEAELARVVGNLLKMTPDARHKDSDKRKHLKKQRADGER